MTSNSMLNLSWVQTFLAVMRSRSFQMAAQQLSLAQPTVSLHIQKLEIQLGVILFVRTRSACTPTHEAKVFLPHAETLIRLNDRAFSAVRDKSVRVGASSNIGIYLLQPHLKAFRDTHPDIPVSLSINRNPQISEMIENGEVDVALMEWWNPIQGFQAKVWKQDALVVIVAPSHPWSHRGAVSAAELSTVPLLGGEPGTGTGKLMQDYFKCSGQVPRVAQQLGSTEAVKQAVQSGLGISLVMRATVENEIRQKVLVALELEGQGMSKQLWLIWKSADRRPEARSNRFVDHLLAE